MATIPRVEDKLGDKGVGTGVEFIEWVYGE